MASALFSVNADATNQGFQGTNSQVLTLRLRQQPPIGVNTVLFQVFDPVGFNAELGIAANPPRASLSAPTLSIVGATTGQAVSPVSVDGSVVITLPASGSHSWIVRCVVNGGTRTLPNGTQVVDPTLIHERGIWIPTVLNARKVVCTELRQFSDGGWADALAALPDFTVADGSIPYVKLVGTAAGVRGIGLTVDSAGKLRTRHRPRRIEEWDYFATGNTTSGSIGKLGWNLLGNGTPVYAKSTGSSLNAFKGSLTTSAAVNDRAVLCWGDTEARAIAIAAELTLLQSLVRVGTTITSMRVFFGLMDDFAVSPTAAVNCLGIYYDAGASANWRIISRVASVGSPVDGGAPFVVPVNQHQLATMYQPTPGTWQFWVGNLMLGSFATGIPTAAMNIGYRVETLTTAARSFHLGYFGINGDPAGALDDDIFLEA